MNDAELRANEQLAGVVTAWGWRPAWDEPAGVARAGGRPFIPPPGAPSVEQLDWLQKIITVALLLLAAPVLLLAFVRNPRGVALGAARKQLG